MKVLKQIRIVNEKSHKDFTDGFPEEKVNFENYLNIELEQLQIENYIIKKINVLTETSYVIEYEIKQ